LFVHKLTPSDYFGLADLLFDKQPSLILVSNSCECILISKEFYVQNSLSKEFYVQNSSIEYLKRLKKNQALVAFCIIWYIYLIKSITL